MRRPLIWPLLTYLGSFASAAQPVEPPQRAVEQAPYHVPAFSNEFVSVLNVFIPPHRESGYHRHSLDSVGVLLSDTARTGRVLGAEAIVTPPRGNGSVNFTGYASAPVVHTLSVTGDVPFHNIVVQLRTASPSGFAVGTRGQGYTQILDNERVRVWRLVLDPGATAPSIRQSAPGVRVVIDGGELVEIDPDGHERGMAPRNSEFFWQDAGQTRAVRNVGATRIELVEIELK